MRVLDARAIKWGRKGSGGVVYFLSVRCVSIPPILRQGGDRCRGGGGDGPEMVLGELGGELVQLGPQSRRGRPAETLDIWDIRFKASTHGLFWVLVFSGLWAAVTRSGGRHSLSEEDWRRQSSPLSLAALAHAKRLRPPLRHRSWATARSSGSESASRVVLTWARA